MRIEYGDYGYRVVFTWPDGTETITYNSKLVIHRADNPGKLVVIK